LGTPDGWFGPAVAPDAGAAPAADHGEPPPETEGSGRTASEPQVDAPAADGGEQTGHPATAGGQREEDAGGA
ncbi:MAG TPA: hypothetical protein VID47_07025, partial [Actinomycetota bacterium]